MKCSNCGHNFTLVESKEQLEKLYSEFFWTGKFRKDIKSNGEADAKPKILKKIWDWFIPIIGANKSRAHSHYLYLKPHVTQKNLFEIGSGTGLVLEYFKKKKFEVYGIEPSKDNCDIINKKFKKRVCDVGFIENWSQGKKYDVVMMSHVFEHVLDCNEVLTKLKNVLTNNGILYIEIPNCSNNKIMQGSINNAPHINHFTKKSFQILSEKNNYKIINQSTFSYVQSETYYGYLKYIVNWILKRDCYVTNQNGEYMRIILTHENK